VTAINPLALNLGIPLAVKAAERGLDMVGQGFHALLSAGATEGVAAQQTPSVSERLQSLANDLRNWLSQNGIRGPFTLNIELPEGEMEPTISVDGAEKESIRSLLSSQPERLESLKEIILTSGQFNHWQPLGVTGSRAVITESSSSLIYS
jgi:hypothetical protein